MCKFIPEGRDFCRTLRSNSPNDEPVFNNFVISEEIS